MRELKGTLEGLQRRKEKYHGLARRLRTVLGDEQKGAVAKPDEKENKVERSERSEKDESEPTESTLMSLSTLTISTEEEGRRLRDRD